MNRILVIGLTVAMLSLSSLYAMEENGSTHKYLVNPNDKLEFVKQYLEDLQSKNTQVQTEFILVEENTEFQEESVQKGFVKLITSLQWAIEFNSQQNKYFICPRSLNSEFINEIKKSALKKVQKQQDTKWYHQVTNHKVRTTVLGVTAVLAFVAGNYYSRK